jgi:hypothetical protein
MPNEIYRGRSFPIPAGLSFFERRFYEAVEGQYRLRLCLFEDEVLLLHD